jgi:CRISPR-associated RAMP protein (TIGR02581 family)
VADSALHVGTGRISTVAGTELPVIRDTVGRPFIPGSSFKGALRSHLETLVRGKALPNTDLKCLACDPTGNECLDAEQMQRLKNKYKDNDAGLAQAVTEKSCLICQTFGSPWLASPVRVRDLPVVADEWFDQFDVRDGVAIDRDKGTVAVGPYDYEVIPAGTRFELYIVAENLAKWQRGLLWLGLRALRRGDVALGGFTSRGLGWVRLEEPEAHLLEGGDALLGLLGGEEVGRQIDDEEAKPWVKAFHERLNGKGAQHA